MVLRAQAQRKMAAILRLSRFAIQEERFEMLNLEMREELGESAVLWAAEFSRGPSC
jgi:hypothetical protein